MKFKETYSMQGVYTLIILLSKGKEISVGKLGSAFFPKGYYVYTGSALGRGQSSLFRRVGRHLLKRKKRHWHIDYLLNVKEAKVINIILSETTLRKENDVVGKLESNPELKAVMKGFGSSDCRKKCIAHLHYFGLELGNLENLVCEAHRSIGLYPKVIHPSLIRH